MAVDSTTLDTGGGGRPWWQYALGAGVVGILAIVIVGKLKGGSGDNIAPGTLTPNAAIALGSVQQQLLEMRGHTDQELLDQQGQLVNLLNTQFGGLSGQLENQYGSLTDQINGTSTALGGGLTQQIAGSSLSLANYLTAILNMLGGWRGQQQSGTNPGAIDHPSGGQQGLDYGSLGLQVLG